MAPDPLQRRAAGTILGLLKEREASKPFGVIAIDGGGGAGKSYLAEQLRCADVSVQVVHIDDFYRTSCDDAVERAEPCWFFDWRRLRDAVLAPLADGQQATFRLHDWEAGRLGDRTQTVRPEGVVVVEGITSLRRELRPWVDVGVWVETPAEVRLARGVERDGEEARETWETFWMPAEARYFDAHATRAAADLIVSGMTPPGATAR